MLDERSKVLCQLLGGIVENGMMACPARQDVNKLQGEVHCHL